MRLLPMVVAQACVRVLPVAGAGVSVTDVLRVPLASSDDTAAVAERLQTTLGEGPCLTASSWREPLQVGVTEMALRWPMFTAKMMELTPYRAVVSLPLVYADPPRHPIGALDLYLSGSTPELPSLDLLAEEIAEPISNLLFGSPPMIERYGTAVPVWMDADPATRRMQVWVAAGMLIAEMQLTSSDAVATLRGYAFSHDLTLEDVADAMVTRSLVPTTVISDTGSR